MAGKNAKNKRESNKKGKKEVKLLKAAVNVAKKMSGASRSSSKSAASRRPRGKQTPAQPKFRLQMTDGTNILKGALGQYADPLNHEPARLPDITSASSVGTACAVLSEVFTMNWESTEPADNGWLLVGSGKGTSPIPLVADKSNRLLVLTRDPVVSGITMTGEWSTATVSYYDSVLTNEVVIAGGPLQFIVRSGDPTPISCGVALLQSGTPRSGDAIPWAEDGARRMLWLDGTPTYPGNVSLQGTFNSVSGASYVGTFLYMYTYYHTGPNERVEVFKSSLTLPALGAAIPPTVMFAAQASGYYSFELTTSNVTSTDLYLQNMIFRYTNNGPFAIRHLLHPDLVNNAGLVQDIRLLGATMLVSNSTAEMYKSGTVYARQLDTGEPWFANVSSPSSFTGLNTQISYDSPLSKGLYAIAKPQGVGCLDLLPAIEKDETTNTFIYHFRPFAIPGTVVALLAPSDPYASGTVSTPALTIHHVRGIEYTTTSQLIKIGKSRMKRRQMDDVLDGLAGIPQFYENPLHLRDVRLAIERAGGWLWKNKASVAAVARALVTSNPLAAVEAVERLSGS